MALIAADDASAAAAARRCGATEPSPAATVLVHALRYGTNVGFARGESDNVAIAEQLEMHAIPLDHC